MEEKLFIEIDEIGKETRKYKIYMCRLCEFYKNKKCIKKRNVVMCARKGLKNK